jgi:hypothetical protein
MLALTLNRPHRQALATLALLGFTVAPTLYVVGVAWRINRPSHVREVEQELGRQLGLEVTLEGVRHLRPGEDVLRGMVLRQAEPRGQAATEVARASVVRIHRAQWHMTLEIDNLSIHGESPKQAMAQVNALLQRAGHAALSQVSFAAQQTEVVLGGGGSERSERMLYRFNDVAGTFQADAIAPTVTISYRVPADSSSTRCELSLTRDRRGEAARTLLTFKTMEGLPLPAVVLEPFFDSAGWLGRSAKVEGTLTLSQTDASDWAAEFSGTLLDVDLAALVCRRFPEHRLTGLARVQVSRARWDERPGSQGPGWVEAEGELASGPGMISMELMRALKREMKFRVPPAVEHRQADLAFVGLGLTFAMSPSGELQVGGALGTEFPPGAVMVDADHFAPLASAPEGVANVRGLIRTLFPTAHADPSVMIPDTAESRILRYLPASSSAAKQTELNAN